MLKEIDLVLNFQAIIKLIKKLWNNLSTTNNVANNSIRKSSSSTNQDYANYAATVTVWNLAVHHLRRFNHHQESCPYCCSLYTRQIWKSCPSKLLLLSIMRRNESDAFLRKISPMYRRTQTNRNTCWQRQKWHSTECSFQESISAGQRSAWIKLWGHCEFKIHSWGWFKSQRENLTTWILLTVWTDVLSYLLRIVLSQSFIEQGPTFRQVWGNSWSASTTCGKLWNTLPDKHSL